MPAHHCISHPCPLCYPNLAPGWPWQWPQVPSYTQGHTSVPAAGCICPPTSEKTCESPTCPRKNHLRASKPAHGF